MKYLFILILKSDEYFEIFRRHITKFVKKILKVFFTVSKQAILCTHSQRFTDGAFGKND